MYHAELMVHLTVLNLSNNKLTILHGVHHLKCLTELILDNNLIEEFQPEIASLSKLKILSAKNNRILLCIILGECMALWGEPSVVIGCICATQ